jgi:SAM-dependent methyltransferase
MTNRQKAEDAFFDHFSKADKPTKLGVRLVKIMSRKIFGFAQAGSGSSVLEIGPGRGALADICLQKGIEYCAVEPNEEMAVSLEKRGAVVVRGIVPPLPQFDRNFDAVIMINVMEHMNSMQDALLISRQIREVLKPKAKLIISSPDYLNWRLNFFNCDFSHNYVTSRRRLRQLLLDTGYENIKSCYLSGPLSGFLCLLVTTFISRLPFGLFNALFPDNKIFYKLYKIQLTFLRKVLMIGEKPG